MIGRLRSRPVRDESDWWRIRGLLIDLYATVPLGSVWDIRRWDERRFRREDPWDDEVRDRCRLWETDDGRLIGVAHNERELPQVFLQIHPQFRSIEGQMLDWAVEEISEVVDGSLIVEHLAFDDDTTRNEALGRHGFNRTEDQHVIRRFPLMAALPAPDVTTGYHVRTTDDDPRDDERLADVVNAAFNDRIRSASGLRTFANRSPSFRQDLNLVAEAVDGSFAAHVGFTYDSANRRGIVEPVCTDPRHQRLGLAQALVFEGLRRLRDLGAELATVETFGARGPNQFYETAGFVEPRWGHWWRWTDEKPEAPSDRG